MKKILFLLAFSAMSTLSFAQETKKKMGPPDGQALVGEVYGAGITQNAEANAITTKKLERKLKKANKIENVAVKGTVTDVCAKKGCWITIKTDSDEQFFVKMKDYAFFVPTALKGKTVILEGKAENKITTVDEQKHYAEDAKKPQSEIDAITKDKKELRFLANGIKVVN